MVMFSEIGKQNFIVNNTNTCFTSLLNIIFIDKLPNLTTEINIIITQDDPKKLVSLDFLSSVTNKMTNYISNFILTNDQMRKINEGLTNVIGKNI